METIPLYPLLELGRVASSAWRMSWGDSRGNRIIFLNFRERISKRK